MRFHVIQHMEWEGPGALLLDAAKKNSVELSVWAAWRGELPSPGEADGLIVLGGSPNVDEEEEYPYLAPLKALMRDAIESGLRVLGFCLGHQLLGHVLGARVGPGEFKSVGFTRVELTAEGAAHPAFRGIESPFHAFKWHGQAVKRPLPEGLELLASSPDCEVEAISPRGAPRVVGLQFDNHAGPKDAAAWCDADWDWASRGTGIDREEILNTAREVQLEMKAWFNTFFKNFLAL